MGLTLIFATSIRAEVITIFDSNAVISDGDTYDTVVVKGGGTVVEMRGGYVGKLYTYDTSVFNMSDGDIDVVRTKDASTFNLSGGFIILFYCYNSSTVNASGGNAYYGMSYRDSSTGNIYDGAYRIDLYDSSKVNVYGGSHFRLCCYGSGTLNVYGDSLRIDTEGGTVNIYRGHIERTLDCSGSSIVNVYGYAFDYDPTGGVRGYGQITGFYSDHTAFSIDLEHGAYPHINLVSVVKTVDIDIKPGSCPNPLNVKSKGVLAVAILGTEDVNVITIDPTSIRLAGVEPLRSGYEDVAAPVSDSNDCNCTTEGPDGFLDLTLKFKTQRIVEAVGDVNDGDVLPLELAGVLFGERLIEGADCIVIRGKAKSLHGADINKDGVVDMADFAIFAQNWLQSSIVDE